MLSHRRYRYCSEVLDVFSSKRFSFSFHSVTLAYVLRGSRISVSTLFKVLGANQVQKLGILIVSVFQLNRR